MTDNKTRVFNYIFSAVIWLIIWQICAMLISMELFLPAPLEVLRVLIFELLESKDFWISIQFSLLHIGAGFILGSLLGILLAVLSSLSAAFEIFLWFPIKVIQSVPVASFVILILLWVKASRLSIIIPFLMVLPTMYTHTLTGIKQTNHKLLEMAQIFRVSTGKKIRYIFIPALLPHVLSAGTLSMGFAWKSGIAAEIIGLARNSIGNQLYLAKIHLLTPELFAWTLVIILMSFACEQLMKCITRKILFAKEDSK